MRIFDFYINSSLHVGFAVLTYSKMVSLHFHQNTDFNWFYFVFFATIVGYNFLKYYDVFKRRNHFFRKEYFSIFVLSTLAILASIYCFFSFNDSLKITVLSSSFLVILYPFLRRFWYLKTVCVAFCVTVFIFAPYFDVISFLYRFNITGIEIKEFVFVSKFFLFILASMVPFEIYDVQYDDKKLQTIPQKFGIEATKIMGCFLILGFLILSFFEKENLKFDLVISFLMVLAIFYSSGNRSKYFTLFWVESIPIVWYLILVFC